MDPPQVLRIKRKRGQDPLQALILEDRPAKKSKPLSPVSSAIITKPSNIYFSLTRTDESTVSDDTVIQSILSESSRDSELRSFVINKRQLEEDTVIPNELSDMVDSFLNVSSQPEPTRKRRKNTTKTTEPEEDYVYDVYHISPEPLTNANHPQSQIGYIRFFDDDNDLYQSDDDDIPKVYSDDEDSNAELFYQNDYPSDEDAGSEQAQENEVLLDDDFEDLYEEFYGENATSSILEDDHFERNLFFASDENDALAIHRDKIFGRLQKMINED